MKVKIISRPSTYSWYANGVGQILEVNEIEHNSHEYLHVYGSILKCDCEVVQEITTKPPLGLRPEFVLLEHRQKEIQEAVTRFMETGLAIPSAWTAEYYRNNSRLLEIKNDN